MKWFLVSEQTVRKLQTTLQAAIERQEEKCGASGCLCDLMGRPCSEFYRDALHELDSDCHTTDAVPSDWSIERENITDVSPTLSDDKLS